ncbi:hypothetical protein GCM10012289_62720 [Nonomuraea cavernae]|uniref:Uncharacterized protein n=1 Tax=Nonomuraea cavernae TaxID=2045107 RepID=A0A917ZAE5_9ACTN|nr:hypothetical protein GCM10012289_62720 [Nonomuraea cavernae]
MFAEFHQGAVPFAKVPFTTSSGAATAGAALTIDNSVSTEAVMAVTRVDDRT